MQSVFCLYSNIRIYIQRLLFIRGTKLNHIIEIDIMNVTNILDKYDCILDGLALNNSVYLESQMSDVFLKEYTGNKYINLYFKIKIIHHNNINILVINHMGLSEYHIIDDISADYIQVKIFNCIILEFKNGVLLGVDNFDIYIYNNILLNVEGRKFPILLLPFNKLINYYDNIEYLMYICKFLDIIVKTYSNRLEYLHCKSYNNYV